MLPKKINAGEEAAGDLDGIITDIMFKISK